MKRVSAATLESSIHRIGEEILRRAQDEAPPIISIERAHQFAMDWLTGDEDLKNRLFQFVSELPLLATPAATAGRLKELLHRDNGHPPLPGIMQLALSYGRSDSILANIVAGLAKWGCDLSARQFICGETIPEAVVSVSRLRRQGMAFTIDLLGETVHTETVARANIETYLSLIRDFSRSARSWQQVPLLDEAPWGPLPRINVSIKLTALVADAAKLSLDAARSAMAEPLRIVLRAAQRDGAFINVDMEHFALKDVTLEVFKSVLTEPEFRDWPDCGIVLQAYLKDAPDDMKQLIAWTRRRATPITVRLVKGAYWDSETALAKKNGVPAPVWQEKWQSDACFEQVGRMMLDASDVIRPTIGSHNVRSIAATLAHADAIGLPSRSVELQMLTGMGDPLKRALVSMSQRVRVYSPFGDLVKGMAYLIRRLIENTSNESFLRQTFSADAESENLLADPARQPLTICP